MNFQQGYINVRTKVEETGETRRETRMRERRRKIVNLAYLAEQWISIFLLVNLILNILGLPFETRNFVLGLLE